jgi:hypothetical protein
VADSTDFHTDDDRVAAETAQGVDSDVKGRGADDIDPAAMEAADGLEVSPSVSENYTEALERGANQQGEGAV